MSFVPSVEQSGRLPPLPPVGALHAAEIPEIVRLLSDMQVSFARSTSPSVYRGVCRDSLAAASPVVAVVARVDGRLAGFAMALIDSRRYWRNFCLRNPLLAFRIVLSRASYGRARPGVAHLSPEAVTLVKPPDPQRSWTDSSPEIAKILFIGTTAPYRRHGLGRQLYQACFETLAERGIRRVDATIGLDNFPSIRLHARTGWELSEGGSFVFATRSIHHPDARKGQTESSRLKS